MAYVVRMHHARLKVQSNLIAAKYLRRVIDDVHDKAVRGATGGPYSRGALAASIYKQGPTTIGFRVIGEVGADTKVAPHAAIVERGARIHDIFPKTASKIWRFGDRRRPQLKFEWRGKTVYTPHVPMSPNTIGRSHPGQVGKHFLLKAMVKAAAKYRLKIRVYEI